MLVNLAGDALFDIFASFDSRLLAKEPGSSPKSSYLLSAIECVISKARNENGRNENGSRS